jgi:uncharacterized protein (DUF2147 family)
MRFSTLQAAISVTAFLSAGPASALSTHDVYGVWRYPDNGSLIRIYPCGGELCAKIVWVADPKRTDVHNPDPALRKRPIVGIVIWRHAKRTASLQWSGSSYNTLDGAIYYGTLQLTGPATLVVAGCNLSVTPCFERTWTKLDTDAAKAITTKVSQPKEPPAAVKKPAAEKIIARKPKARKVRRARKPKPLPRARAVRPREPNRYNELPHIHIRRYD